MIVDCVNGLSCRLSPVLWEYCFILTLRSLLVGHCYRNRRRVFHHISGGVLWNVITSFTLVDYDLQGSTSGPIYLDTVDIGGYSIESQAFAATSTIVAEELSQELSGILGLALQGNSIIHRTLLDSSNQGGGDIPVMRLFADEDVGGPQSRHVQEVFSVTITLLTFAKVHFPNTVASRFQEDPKSNGAGPTSRRRCSQI